MQAIRKLLGISYKDHITNDAVRDRIRQAIGPCNDILTTVKKWKLKWFSGHVSISALLATTILQGTVQGVRRRGRQRLKFSHALRLSGKKKRLNGGKGLLGPWRLHDDYRISAKIGESRNK